MQGDTGQLARYDLQAKVQPGNENHRGAMAIPALGWFIFMLLVLAPGCTEVYIPELEQVQDIMYVEGGITDAAGPHMVNLRYTAGYNDKPGFNPVRGGMVFLREEGTEVCRLREEDEGIYLTDSLFRASPGRSYQLVIEMPDGQVYESVPQEVPVYNIPLDSLYGYRENRKIKYYNVYGELILLDQEVNQLYADISPAEKNTFYRFGCQLILEHASGIIASPGSNEPDIIDLYMWDSFYPRDLSVIEVNTQRGQLKKFPLTHAIGDNDSYEQLKYQYFPAITAAYDGRIRDIVQVEVETDTGIFMVDSILYGIPVQMSGADYYYGWILKIRQYSITQEAYTFWSDIKKLEETEGEIFDPITTQLRGNMRCATDTEKPVLGLFEVASERESMAFVNYTPINGYYPGKRLNDLIDFPDKGWQDTIPPAFWVEKIYIGPDKGDYPDLSGK